MTYDLIVVGSGFFGLTIAERAADDWFRIEEYLARENDASTNTGTPPSVAGGAV